MQLNNELYTSDDYGNMSYCNPTTNQRVSLTTTYVVVSQLQKGIISNI